MPTTSKTILITGATAGIGRHAALHLSSRGHHVIATGRNQAILDALRAEALTAVPAGARFDVLRLDVNDAASIREAVASVDALTEGRGLDALVNNAGYGIAGAVEEISDADLRAQFDTNVFGVMAVTRAFLPRMRARGAGRIVNVSSIGGRFIFPMMGAYNASKFALEGLSDALRLELRPAGIEVALIEPGPIRSEFSDRMFDTVPKSLDGSHYAEAYARAGALKARSDAQAAGPLVVSKAIERAIVSRRPSARYVVPRGLALVLALMTLLPTRWTDALLRRLVGLTGGVSSAKRLAQAT